MQNSVANMISLTPLRGANNGGELVLSLLEEKNAAGQTNWQVLKEKIPLLERYRLQHHIANSVGQNKVSSDNVSATGFFGTSNSSIHAQPDADTLVLKSANEL